MSASADPKFTIITPTYKQAGFIASCIQSVQQQTYRNYEHLIYDPFSPDGTDLAVARFLDDRRIEYRREPDAGQADAINKGLDAATGDIVCWLNSDDAYFDEDVLGRVATLFRQHPGVDLVTGSGYYIAEDGRFLRPCVTPDSGRIGYENMRKSDYFMQPSTFWRRNSVRLDVSLAYCFDWKFFLDLYAGGASVLYVPEYFSKYRLQAASKTVLDNAARRGEVAAVLRYAGAGQGQIAWASFVHGCYALSERLKFPALRASARTLNLVAHRLTAGRIFSP
jgi:glycosyltransferase involved in cell wall biosynthesis